MDSLTWWLLACMNWSAGSLFSCLPYWIEYNKRHEASQLPPWRVTVLLVIRNLNLNSRANKSRAAAYLNKNHHSRRTQRMANILEKNLKIGSFPFPPPPCGNTPFIKHDVLSKAFVTVTTKKKRLNDHVYIIGILMYGSSFELSPDSFFLNKI